MDPFEELQRLASNASIQPSTSNNDKETELAIQRWRHLFNYTPSQAHHLLTSQLQNDELSRNRLADSQWELVRSEQEPLGHDRISYEHSLDLLSQHRRVQVKHSSVVKNPRGISKREEAYTYLLKLEGPLLCTREKIAEAAGGMGQIGVLVEDEDKTAVFCHVNGLARFHILRWLEEKGEAFAFAPTFTRIVMPARKELQGISIYPTLGKESTLPQFRVDDNVQPVPRQEEFPVWYFFYGTLADRAVLARVLSLDEMDGLVLREARVLGGVLKSWGGKYRALVDGSEREEVVGSAFLVTCEEHEDALRQYETDNYEVVRCTILMGGGEVVEGCTFRFVGDVD